MDTKVLSDSLVLSRGHVASDISTFDVPLEFSALQHCNKKKHRKTYHFLKHEFFIQLSKSVMLAMPFYHARAYFFLIQRSEKKHFFFCRPPLKMVQQFQLLQFLLSLSLVEFFLKLLLHHNRRKVSIVRFFTISDFSRFSP